MDSFGGFIIIVVIMAVVAFVSYRIGHRKGTIGERLHLKLEDRIGSNLGGSHKGPDKS